MLDHGPPRLTLLVMLSVFLPVINNTSMEGAKRLFTPEDFIGFKSVSDAQISPDGKHVAFVLGNVYKLDS
ncbi:MAG: hypothetical protein DMG06_10995, partial [Acidobacteria bacterium]